MISLGWCRTSLIHWLVRIVSTFFDPADALGLSRSQERTPVGVAMFRKKASAIACNKTKPSAARKRLSISKDAIAP